MKRVNKSVLLWYSAREMYALVIDVHSYPQFLPWCERAEVLETHDDGETVRLSLAYAGLHHAFTTRNRHVADESVEMDLIDGPFSHLDGTWHFAAIGRPGSNVGAACRIGFDLTYGFSSRALESAVSPVFDRIANTFVDSFVRRAEAVYGPR